MWISPVEVFKWAGQIDAETEMLINRQNSPRQRNIHTGVADIEAFSSVGMIRLKFQSHDVTVGSDLRRNVFSRECPKCGHLRQAFEKNKV